MGTLMPDDFISKALTAFFLDAGNQFQIATRDLKANTNYLVLRHMSEGIGFVTKTLPTFGKLFDRALLTGRLSMQTALKKRSGTPLPLCLTGLVNRVFGQDGTLLDSPDIKAIKFIRQLCFQFYKLEVDYSKECVDEKIRQFVTLDDELVHNDTIEPDRASIIYEANRFVQRVFAGFDPKEISPRPGPGQSSDRRKHWMRYEPHVLYSKVHNCYPYYSYYYINSRHLLARVGKYRDLPRHPSGVSRLALVPKDSRGPRIICMEPCEYMWLQQGLGRRIMDHLEQHPLTKGHVNFTDQGINRGLALTAHKRGLATLDMKEASDRISKTLVDAIFHDTGKLKDCLLALSTDMTELPSKEVISTKKFAPMGSALCFPVMSIVHFALGVAVLKHKYPNRSYKALAKNFFVYGDDLIVATKDVPDFFEQFPIYGLKFNQEKCCYEGLFRESCGVDAYDGHQVTPVRVHKHTFDRKRSVELLRHVACCNNLEKSGYYSMSVLWKKEIESAYGILPYVTPTSSVIGWHTPKSEVMRCNIERLRYDKNLQTLSMKARICKTRPYASMLGGWEQLMRAQLHAHERSTPFTLRDQAKIVWARVPLSGL